MEKIPNLIEMSGSSKKPDSSKKHENSPEQARESYTKRFTILTSSTKEKLAQYKAKLQDDSFEDKEGEPEGAGEKRKEEMQKVITHGMDRIESMKDMLDSGEEIPETTKEIQVDYIYTNPKTSKVEKQETITLDIEKKLEEFTDFYKTTNINTPPDFKEQVEDIWSRNSDEIQKAIEEQGFDDMIIAPAHIPLTELSEKMKMENGYYDYIKSNKTVPDLSGIPLTSIGADTIRIILVHKSQNLKDRPELEATQGVKAHDIDQNNSLSLEDYIIFQNKYFKETGKHLDVDGWTWTPRTKSGPRFVCSGWDPGTGELCVSALVPGYSIPYLGCRPSRYFT